jgi:nicotinamide-nucleotide amidase
MNSSIELISIGTELLSGRTLNTHAQTLGAALTGIGLTLARDTTIPDRIDIIRSVVKEAFERSDIVLVSGGLGPTVDDMTRDALAGLLGVKIVMSAAALAAMQQRFDERGIRMTPASERMALILDGAETLINHAGCAAAQRLELPNNKILFVVPGPPVEFAGVLNDHIVPWLKATFPDAAPDDLRVLMTQGLGESFIVMILEKEKFDCSEFSVGFYPGGGRVEIRLSAPPQKSAALDVAEHKLRELLHDWLID